MCESKLSYLCKKKVTFVTLAKSHECVYIDCINKMKRR